MGDEQDEAAAELDKLFGQLRKLKPCPKRLKVLCTDSETRDVIVPASRQKWQSLRKKIGALDWLRVEAYNARGEYLDGFEGENAGEEFEEDSNTVARDIAFFNAVARQVKLNSESVKDALSAQTAQNKALLDGAARCIEMSTLAAASLQRTYETRIKILDAMVEEGGSGDTGLMSSKFLDLMGGEIAKAAAPEIIAKVVKGNSKGNRK